MWGWDIAIANIHRRVFESVIFENLIKNREMPLSTTFSNTRLDKLRVDMDTLSPYLNFYSACLNWIELIWIYSFIDLINTSSMNVSRWDTHEIWNNLYCHLHRCHKFCVTFTCRQKSKQRTFYWYIDHHAQLVFSVNCSVQCDFRTMVETVWIEMSFYYYR